MNKSLFLSAVKGLGVGLLITLVLLLVGNLIALKTPDPDTVASLMAHGIRILAGFATGFAAARFQRERGLVTGITAGALYTAVLALGAAFMAGDFSFLPEFWRCAATGFFELGSGIASLRGFPPEPPYLALAAFMLGWGGLSVHGQTLGVLAGTDIKCARHLAGRALCGVFSAAYAFVLSYLI